MHAAAWWPAVLRSMAADALGVLAVQRLGITCPLRMHDCSQHALRCHGCAGRWGDALGELLASEEAFGLAEPSLLEGIDNVAMLLIDIVWCGRPGQQRPPRLLAFCAAGLEVLECFGSCAHVWRAGACSHMYTHPPACPPTPITRCCFKLQDASRLGVSQQRLARARAALARAHGPNQERARVLHGNFCPEHATYVRLETLEGMVAYYTQDWAAAEAHLRAAQARWQLLQVCVRARV